MKNLPVGVQHFKKIIKGDYVYIDKTQYIYNLINDAKYYFLSRPRRFGKSLLLDTIAEVFGGDRELFSGLWIYESNYEFVRHPAIRFDMSNMTTESPETLKESLVLELNARIKEEGLDIPEVHPADMFKVLIKGLCKKYGKKVVVLIDEYDKPILDHLDDLKMAEANGRVLRGFYGILKSMDPFLRFTFFTGVTKFTKTSIFSELNNLFDITLTERYSDICGITIEDFDKYFQSHIEYLSSLERFGHIGDIRKKVLEWYDGYSWNGQTKVLNPFSLLSFFMQERFSAFWYASGTPKFLVGLIKQNPVLYPQLKNLEITEYMLDSTELDKIVLEPLLFQTGYLTIKEILYEYLPPIYVLDIPNHEVREAFDLNIISALTESDDVRTGQARISIGRALKSGDLGQVLTSLRSLFASIPYNLHIELEAYYHSIFYAVMSVLGFDVEAEVSTSRGKVDASLELEDKLYIMEFKYEKCPPETSPEGKQTLFKKALKEAMAQIKSKKYGERYKSTGKTIYYAAFAFIGRDEIEMQTEIS